MGNCKYFEALSWWESKPISKVSSEIKSTYLSQNLLLNCCCCPVPPIHPQFRLVLVFLAQESDSYTAVQMKGMQLGFVSTVFHSSVTVHIVDICVFQQVQKLDYKIRSKIRILLIAYTSRVVWYNSTVFLDMLYKNPIICTHELKTTFTIITITFLATKHTFYEISNLLILFYLLVWIP